MSNYSNFNVYSGTFDIIVQLVLYFALLVCIVMIVSVTFLSIVECRMTLNRPDTKQDPNLEFTC